MTFDRSGRLLAADKSGVAEVDLLFDKLGRLTQETLTYLPSNDAYTTEYDYTVSSSGATRTITYPGSRTVTETYDKRLRLTDVGAGTGVGTSFSYDDADRRTALTRDNGVTGTISFNLNDWITAITHSHASPPTWTSALEYGYDPVGNRIYASNSLQADRSEVYTYDQRHRLLGFTRGTITSWTTSSWGASIPNAVTALPHATIPGGQTWGLDKRGNWGSFSEMLGTPTLAAIPQTRTFNGVNEVQAIDPDAGGPASSVSLYHDAKGKLTHDPFAPNYGGSIAPGQQYEYDAENRLISVTTDDITPGSKQMTHHAPAAAA